MVLAHCDIRATALASRSSSPRPLDNRAMPLRYCPKALNTSPWYQPAKGVPGAEIAAVHEIRSGSCHPESGRKSHARSGTAGEASPHATGLPSSRMTGESRGLRQLGEPLPERTAPTAQVFSISRLVIPRSVATLADIGKAFVLRSRATNGSIGNKSGACWSSFRDSVVQGTYPNDRSTQVKHDRVARGKPGILHSPGLSLVCQVVRFY